MSKRWAALLAFFSALLIAGSAIGQASVDRTKTGLPFGSGSAISLRGVAPSLDLDFTTGGVLDSRITYSGGSGGTYIDSNGVLRPQRQNLIPRSQDFNSWGKTNSTVSSDVTTAPDGTLTADKIIPSAGTANGFVSQVTSAVVGAPYTFSVYAKAAERSTFTFQSNLTGSFIPVRWDISAGTVTFTGAGYTASIQNLGNGWYRCIATVISTTTTPTLQIANNGAGWNGDGTSGFFLWGAQFEPGPTVTPYIATTTAASAGQARFDYDPITLAAKGVLVEEQRTNLLPLSSQVDQWALVNTTATANVITAPDGTVSADRVAETAATGGHQVAQAATIPATSTITWSVFVKAGERSQVSLLTGAPGGSLTASFDLTTGVPISVNVGTTATVTPFANGWWRLSVTGTSAGGGSTFFYVAGVSGGTGNYTGDPTKGWYVWGGQVESASFATSYIPTTTAAVTRTADSPQITGSISPSWFNAAQGTFVVEGDSESIGGVNRFFMSANDGTISNEFNLFVTSSGGVQASINAGGVSQGSPFSSTPLVSNSTSKAALVYDTNYLNGAVNGAILPNGSPATPGVLPAVSRLSLGTRGNNTFSLNGHLRALRYYPQRLPNATLQRMTQ